MLACLGGGITYWYVQTTHCAVIQNFNQTRDLDEMLKAFEKVSGKTIAYKMAPRRPGDIAACYSDPSLAKRELNWQAELDLNDMAEDSWRWQQANPNGFA